MSKIIINKIQCNLCKDVIVSDNRHDFKYCSCGSVACDGGSDFLRRSGLRSNYTELSVVVPDDHSILDLINELAVKMKV